MIEDRATNNTYTQSEKRHPLSPMLRYVARVTTALAVGMVHGLLHGIWRFAHFLLCMFRPVVNVLMIGGVITVPISFAAYVKPESANGMPFWVFLLMAIGFVGVSMGYSKFVDWIAPPGTEDPASRYRRPDWR